MNHAVFRAAALASSLVLVAVACSSSSSPSAPKEDAGAPVSHVDGGQIMCPNPPVDGGASEACLSCVAKSCTNLEATVTGACPTDVACYVKGDCTPAALLSCVTAASPPCQTAFEDLSGCIMSSCKSLCPT
jgi:hypothetical protein